MGEDRMKNHDFHKEKSGGEGRPSLTALFSCGCGRINGFGQGGFTLVELLTVSAILGLIMTIAIPSYTKFVYSVKIARAVSEIAALERDIVAYQVDRNVLPDNLSDFGRGGLQDPWGNPYVYLKLPDLAARNDAFSDLNTEFDCYSKGADGLTAVLTNDPVSKDDIVRGGDGAFYGLASNY